MFQYIGELCRYLLNAPPHPKERKHRVRLACGNGLRPDIWADFQRRFRIPKILEWYAATEGNCVFLNFDGKIGAVGRIPAWAKRRFVTKIVRFDIDSEQPVRGADGFCIKCGPGEVGRSDLADPERSANARASASRAMPTRRRPKRRSCATCSRRATAGSAPAT